MKKYILIGILQVTGLLAMAQQKQIQYLSGTDAAHTVQWDFFCTAGRNSGSGKNTSAFLLGTTGLWQL